MPKVNWGVGAAEIDDFDRSSQYMPYTGPTPPDGMYLWQIKVLQSIAGTKDKFPQLRIGLAFVPREGRDGEDRYIDDNDQPYWIMAFLPITDKTAWRYVPFLDSIGVSGAEFTRGTLTDEEGNVKKIGRWKNSGEELVLAQLKTGNDQHGNPQKQIGVFAPAPEDSYASEDEDEYDLEED